MVDGPSALLAESIVGLFPDRREAGETNLRRCQLVMIRMLKILDRVCRDNRISYWMTAGTLIGALRHRGMIPWDCDIDVGMTEEDLESFTGIADQPPPDIFFQTNRTDPLYPQIAPIKAKLRDHYSNYTEWQQKNPWFRWQNGLQVDLLLYRRNEAGQLINPARGTAYEPSEIFPLTNLEFEGSRLLTPKNAISYINRRYGDLMTLPPPEQRVAHEGRADPFKPCDHPESRPYPRKSWIAKAMHRLP